MFTWSHLDCFSIDIFSPRHTSTCRKENMIHNVRATSYSEASRLACDFRTEDDKATNSKRLRPAKGRDQVNESTKFNMGVQIKTAHAIVASIRLLLFSGAGGDSTTGSHMILQTLLEGAIFTNLRSHHTLV